MKDGSGVINLAALGDSEGFLMRDRKIRHQTGGSEVEESLTFSPCHTFSEPEAAENCPQVVLCVKTRVLQSWGDTSYYSGFGQHNANDFSYNNDSKILSVTYQAFPLISSRAIVHFNCSPLSSITFSQDTQNPEIREILVQDPCVCPNSCQTGDVGPGTIILILFATSTVVYFLFGACSLRSVRTSEGTHLTPENHLWCSICFVFRKKNNLWKTIIDSGSRETFGV
ncbi:uncharacterized protein RCH25_004709 [Pelodytes ibericus]